MAQTLFDKIWDAHVVEKIPDGPSVLYIDKHFIHEVTSPQAFKGIEKRGLPLFRPKQTIATADHNVPTLNQHLPIKDQLSKMQVDQLIENCEKHGVELYGLGHPYQGIVHVIGPELGITQPGMTIVCGDSHTCTYGAFGALAFGIGTTQVSHVLATQTMAMDKLKVKRVNFNGRLQNGTSAKDLALFLIKTLGVKGGVGFAFEFNGEAIDNLSMEESMTLCNLAVECGARSGYVNPDETTFEYLKGKPKAPKEDFEKARKIVTPEKSKA